MIVKPKDKKTMKIFIGPMWSFKTTHMINKIKKLRGKGAKVYVFAPKGSQREDRPFLKDAIELEWEEVSQEPKIVKGLPIVQPPLLVKTKDFEDKINALNLKEDDWIAIDEIQFFNPEDFPPLLKKLNMKYNVLCAGLDVNYTSRIFETTHKLCQFTTQWVKLKGLCYECDEPSEFYDKKEGVKEGIGGADLYKPKCFKHVELLTRTLRW